MQWIKEKSGVDEPAVAHDGFASEPFTRSVDSGWAFHKYLCLPTAMNSLFK